MMDIELEKKWVVSRRTGKPVGRTQNNRSPCIPFILTLAAPGLIQVPCRVRLAPSKASAPIAPPASADFLADALQGFVLLSQHPRQFPQHFPRPAFVATHRGSRLTLGGLRPGRLLPRFPARDQFRSHCPMLGRPVVAHGLPLIVGFARFRFPAPAMVPPCRC